MSDTGGQKILVSHLRSAIPLVDGRTLRVFDVIGHSGLVIKCYGWDERDGSITPDTQFFELSDGRRFRTIDAAVSAWHELYSRPAIENLPPLPSRTHSHDAEIQARRFVERSVIPSRLKALDSAGVSHKLIRDGHCLVDDRFEYYAAVGYWRDRNSAAHGYTVERLIEAARGSTKPAAGRDSVVDPHVKARPAAIAESVAGDLPEVPVKRCDGSASASLLPSVRP